MADFKFSTLEKDWLKEAKGLNKTIVLPEASMSEDIVKAGIYLAKNNICDIVLLVKNDDDLKTFSLEKYNNIRVVNYTNHELLPMLVSALHIKRQAKGLTLDGAKELLKDPIYFATMMVELGLVDGSVSGICVPSKDTFKPAFQIIKCQPNKKAYGVFLMIPEGKGKVYMLGDCAIVENPTSEELADLAESCAENYRKFVGMEPKVALLSYSTKGSGDGELLEKVRKSIEIMKDKSLDFKYDGELQLDSAVVFEVASKKCPESEVGGQANVLIFPDLNAGNIGYKIMQRFGGYTAVGPIVVGLNKPINDLSRGASIKEIITTVAITILQSK